MSCFQNDTVRINISGFFLKKRIKIKGNKESTVFNRQEEAQ